MIQTWRLEWNYAVFSRDPEGTMYMLMGTLSVWGTDAVLAKPKHRGVARGDKGIYVELCMTRGPPNQGGLGGGGPPPP